MGQKKRRQDDDDDNDDNVGDGASESDASQSEQTVKPKVSTTSKGKGKTVKKPKYDVSKEETSPVRKESKQAVKVLQNDQGDKYVDLGKNKHASVREFHGVVFLDIREFYSGKPGKKGITLSNEQWEILKQNASTIDSFFAEHGKK